AGTGRARASRIAGSWSWSGTARARLAHPWRLSLVRVGDEQFLRGKPGNDLDAAVHHDDLLLQPGGRDAIAGRAVGLQREHHALLDLHRGIERGEPADDRALVQRQAEPVAELQAE